jgi:succinoglycan biosynthesis protein ExoO
MTPADLIGVGSRSPTVSVIVPNYNGAAYLAQSIGSACRQTLRDIEIIVSDDASTDASVAIVRQLMEHDARIRLVTSERNGGPAVARNRALAAATGEWIAVMDSDDLMHPGRLAMLLEAAVRDQADMVADDLLAFDTNFSERPYAVLTGRWACDPFWVDIADYVRLNRLYGSGPHLGYLKPLFRSSLFVASGVRYDELLRVAQDYDLVLRLLRYGAKFRVYPLLMYFYRRHSASNSYRISHHALKALKNANLRFRRLLLDSDQRLRSAVDSRTRSIETALAFDRFLGALKARNWARAGLITLTRPQLLRLFRFPITTRLRRLLKDASSSTKSPCKPHASILSRQRIIGKTNGSSAYLLEIVTNLTKHGFDVHFLSPSPATLGRWPYLFLSSDLSIFSSFRIRGTWRVGRFVFSYNPWRLAQGILALAEKTLIKLGLLSSPVLRRAPYSIGEPLTRADQLYIAEHTPSIGDLLIADYCFLTETFPFALRPDARTFVLMHDLFSSRMSQFKALETSDSVVSLTEEDECARLAKADIIIAIQQDEAAFLRSRLPSHRVIVAPMATYQTTKPQPGKNDLVLFVGSMAAPNVDGLRWFLRTCWPRIRAKRSNVNFYVAGTVCQIMGPSRDGVRFLGFVSDLGPLYADAGVIVSPLRVGSGLKIKLIEAIGRGKAVVATSATLKGVADLLAKGVRVEDEPDAFAAAVVALLDDERARVELGAYGLELAAKHFSPASCYDSFAAVVAEARRSCDARR